ncbi:50S ribosomal protein L25/general stress protein Ctc [Laspinema olomoucense]|uniref:50S ribosomal protein L25/general stress protein Ctc n=1 Tax=Laspinema olomoucense TaxID=3231600 RepID=UPI0021BB875F|nr:50S ribosomal protein L25/general stress protein Ctc [Laspinema sp. D3d]MCT7975042.1 50S ribosomal protein L25/general stress protein Ctc [Laspinema sp. D3d]
MTVIVECQKRHEGSKPKALRREGLIPASLYGHQGSESISLTIPAKVAEKLLKEASVNNTLVDLNIPDLSWKGQTILREVQTHPWKSTSVYHISFFAVSAGTSLDLVVPLHFVGEPHGVTQEGGVLDIMMTELPIQCTRDNIPDSIEINIAHLKLGDSLQVHDLPLSEGVTAHVEGDRTVLAILQSRNSEKSGSGEGAEEGATA